MNHVKMCKFENRTYETLKHQQWTFKHPTCSLLENVNSLACANDVCAPLTCFITLRAVADMFVRLGWGKKTEKNKDTSPRTVPYIGTVLKQVCHAALGKHKKRGPTIVDM